MNISVICASYTCTYFELSSMPKHGSDEEAIKKLDQILAILTERPPTSRVDILYALKILKDECGISLSDFHNTLLNAAIYYLS